jgi:transposase-like protein
VYRMSQRRIREYDKEFKQNAINLYFESGKSASQIASELGVPLGTLVGWVKAYKKDKTEAFPGKGYVKPSDQEIVRLRKELAIAQEERDILKKALGIFSSIKK